MDLFGRWRRHGADLDSMKTLHSFWDCWTYILAGMNSLVDVLSLTKRLGIIGDNLLPLYSAFWLYLLSRSECCADYRFNMSGVYLELFLLLAIPTHGFNYQAVTIILLSQPSDLFIFLCSNKPMFLSYLINLSLESSMLGIKIIS